jgi:GDP/GTP exchange factor required for growth at low temperature
VRQETAARLVLDTELGNRHSTTAPNNDPRFVLWGVAAPPDALDLPGQPHFRRARATSDNSDPRFAGTGRYSRPKLTVSTVASSTISSASSTIATSVTPSSENLRSDMSVSTSAGKPILLAASIERWVAQLTSELNYDELLDFFLTYRTYISSLELLHLFIFRFHWSLTPSTTPVSEPTEDEEDSPAARADMIKRVVRVRTFIALRYWLMTPVC